jgi:hypothetical protein
MALANPRLEGTITVLHNNRYSATIEDDGGHKYFLAWKNMDSFSSGGFTSVKRGARVSFIAVNSDKRNDMPVALEVRLVKEALDGI